MDAEAVRQLRMGLGWFFLVRGDNGSYLIIGFIGWIVLYRIGWIVSYHRLDRIVSAGSGNTGFYALAGYWLDGTDGLDGALVGRGCDGRTLEPAGMGAPPWAPEKEHHCWILRGGRLWVLAKKNSLASR